MTAPLPPWMQQQDQAAIRFEEQVAADATTALQVAVAEAARQMAAAYIQTAGDLTQSVPPPLVDQLKAALRRAAAALATGLISEMPAVIEGLNAAIRRGMSLGAGTPGRPRRMRLQPTQGLLDTLDRVDQAVREELAALQGAVETSPLQSYRDVLPLVAAARRPVNRVESAARWAANRAVNEGAAAVADAHGVPRLWVAERDACLTCLAYAGELAEPGQPFPAGRTFGKPGTSTVKEPVYGPPAHPRCRCRIQPWFGQDMAFGVPLPSALKREAARSVLRGDTGYASAPARLDAASRLLATGLSGLPETVQLRARRKVAAGVGAWRRR